MLFNEPMGRHEAIQVCGYQTYSRRTGYDSTLKYNGPAPSTKQADFDEGIGVHDTRLTAIDALPINSFCDQYTYPVILRELNKAFVGFHQLNFFGEVSFSFIVLVFHLHTILQARGVVFYNVLSQVSMLYVHNAD
ncbi:hypothetical protein EB796_023753 [Bugula neritina]|uniref:PARG catalytic Macro domain-containing protein n=1 Tax=Bugula neritina TaxID=10212 RepID=A0A7J7IVK2_BUGNE|nr:hypothetical protein EB796_023753 [Bugula neritina]